jgi:drug/metabolite transporter (DMT)-like permease
VNRRAWLLFAAVSVLWGIPYFFIKIALVELSPPVVVAARTAIAAVILVPIAIAQGVLPAVRRRLGTIVVLSLVHIVGPFLLITYGEVHITSSLTGLLIASEPIMIALLAARFNTGDRITLASLAGLGLGLLGVVVLVGLDLGGDRLGLLGAGMVLVATVSYAVATIVVKRRGSAIPPLGMVAGTMVVSTVVLAPFAVLTLPSQPVSPRGWTALLVLGLLCTALALLAFYQLIAIAGPSRAGLVTYVNPAVAVVLGVMFLGEPLHPTTIVAFVLILAGCWLSTRQPTTVDTNATGSTIVDTVNSGTTTMDTGVVGTAADEPASVVVSNERYSNKGYSARCHTARMAAAAGLAE